MGKPRYSEAEWAGKVFGRLTVLGRGPRDKRNHPTWRAVCACGGQVSVPLHRLTSGNTRSCGCLQPESVALASRTHGMTATWATDEQLRTHDIWVGMLGRCRNAASDSFHNYGGRGIDVCSRWDDFENFVADMGTCPKGYTLERLDNQKGYSQENCSWWPKGLQNSNTRRTIRVHYAGDEWCLMQLVRRLGLKYPTVQARYRKLGWSLARSLGLSDTEKLWVIADPHKE